MRRQLLGICAFAASLLPALMAQDQGGERLTSQTLAGIELRTIGSEHIGKILVDPRNSNVVYVAFGRMTGDQVTPIGQPQAFQVVQIPQ